jgi:hypothetical protein
MDCRAFPCRAETAGDVARHRPAELERLKHLLLQDLDVLLQARTIAMLKAPAKAQGAATGSVAHDLCRVRRSL